MNYPTQQYPPQAPQQPVQPQYPTYPQQYPTYPQQQPGYPAQAPQYAQPPAQYPQAPGYPQAPPQQPAAPLAQGSIDEYYNQPSAGGGPSISWSDKNRQPKPLGTRYVGIVARDVTNADIQQQTDFNTKQPLFYRDGRPKFAMKVPLKVTPSEEFPEGEATWFVKGQARDELVRAMGEAGTDGAPKAGAGIVITLVQRRSSGAGLNPANVVQVQYQPPVGAGASSPAPAQSPVQQPVQQAPAQPEQYQQPAAQQYAQPAPPQAAQAQPQYAQQQAPAQSPASPQGPADMSEEQRQLLARLTGQPA